MSNYESLMILLALITLIIKIIELIIIKYRNNIGILRVFLNILLNKHKSMIELETLIKNISLILILWNCIIISKLLLKCE